MSRHSIWQCALAALAALLLQGCPLSDAYYIEDDPSDSRTDAGASSTSGGFDSPTGGTSPFGSTTTTGGSYDSGGFGTPDSTSGGGPAQFSQTTGSSSQDTCDLEWDGLCWKLGNLGASCTDTCESFGGPAPNLAEYVGTASQGGSLQVCQQLLTGLNVAGLVSSGPRPDAGVGCHLWGFSRTPWWLTDPVFDPDARSSNARIVCGCVGAP